MDFFEVIIIDLGVIALVAFSILGLRRITDRGYMQDALGKMMAIRRVRISYYIILFYLVVGLLELIRIPHPVQGPGDIKIENPSLIDLVFLGTEKERTYSAPFGSVALGIKEGTENDPLNKVKGIHILGTDINGNDVFLKILKGANTALLLAFGVVMVSFPIGIILGMLAGYFGGWVDDLIQWLYTTIASVPWLLFVIAFLMVFGRGIFWISLAMGLTGWVELARLIRGETLKIKNLVYIRAARAAGLSHLRILIRQILPNLMHLVIILITLSASNIILAESILTFIGIGVEPGTASWGAMLTEAQNELMRSPTIWWIFVAGSFVGIFPLVLCLNIFGDALRDALDPRLTN